MNGRKISAALLQLSSAIALMLGIAYFISATTTPGTYRLYSASAVQASQVYTEALYYAALSISSFLFGIFMQVAMYFGGYYKQPRIEDIAAETNAIRNMLKKIGGLLQQANGQAGIVSQSRKPTVEQSGMRALLNQDEPEF